MRLMKGSGKADDGKGTWCAWKKDGRRPILDIMCPLCGKSFFLEKGQPGEKGYEAHGVHSDGRVFPSVVCPFRCGFHAYVILLEWDNGELQEIL